VTIDPNNPLTVWVGSGENNSQRSVSYGDGVYKSVDSGKTWKNVGLKNSEHIAKIVVDPRDSDAVYVASQGPLWSAGGDRGLYKTSDGGKTWDLILEIDGHTGVTDLVYDPRDPDILYAAAYQRGRRVWTLIDGGPGSAIYKSTDAGKTWNKLKSGLPRDDMGRIGLAISPANPDVLYAIIEAANGSGGFFRSLDRGENWEKRSGYVSGSPQYYQEIVCDPKEVGRVYSLDTYIQVTEDGGKTFSRLGERYKHVDNHSLWIDPDYTSYLLAGCDGGIYESFDRGTTWHFKENLPVTQFYRVSVDNDFPFYNVYGGTQDNFSLGGPSRTTNVHGIRNSDWYVTQGGDGFETVIDPEDPNIVYSQLQYGRLVRFDRNSGERISIQPQPDADGEPLKWNWDSALIISSHLNTRLYFAANKLFRSDDRGNSWRAVSPDLTRQLDRNQLEIMGRVWPVDAVAKNRSTSFYGTIVSLAESPLAKGLLYVGTDDGLIQVTEDGGANWRKIDKVPDVPELSYVSDIETSLHDPNTIYASFDNHKAGDFKPYLYKSTDRGKTWKSINSNLPERGTVYALAEDHVQPGLLFAGTEFGAFFSGDNGQKWTQLKSGLPTIAVRDLTIQRRENDLVLGTFGRGFYILDDYSSLRSVNSELLEKEAELFTVKDAWMYMQDTPLGRRGKSFQGDAFYTADNPAFGAIFTYYLKDELKTRKKMRQEREKKASTNGGAAATAYPTWDELRAEAREEKPAIVFTVTDEEGNVVRRLTGSTKSGIHRIAWDLRYPPATPTRLGSRSQNSFRGPASGPMTVPGTYIVAMAKHVDGQEFPLSTPQTFTLKPLGTATLPAQDPKQLLTFQRKTGSLQRAVLGASRAANEALDRIKYIKKAIIDTPEADPALAARANELAIRLDDLMISLNGDRIIRSHSEPAPPSITSRVQEIVRGHWNSTSVATQTFRDLYDIASNEFDVVLEGLRVLVEQDLKQLEGELETVGAPWTPGRVPTWTRK
jgi:photosystem II stability/assembly factor-like uncharacterized protein